MRANLLGLAVVVVSGCGLLDPPGPPARVLGDPGTRDAPFAQATDPGVPGQIAPRPPFPGFALAFHDEFDGVALDENKWKILLGPWRSGLDARDTIQVKDGLFSLTVFTDTAGAHHAGRITTDGSFEATYGYFEIRARFLDSVGQWCSFFLWPRTIRDSVGDPGTSGVEIDVFEHRDVDQYGSELRDMVQAGLIWAGPDNGWERENRMLAHPLGAPLSHAWHTYAALWTDSLVTFYIDEIPVWTTSAALSHRPEPIYVTCEVWDGAWDGSVPAGGYGTRETSTTGMEVDWVRVWQRPP
ncbi:glycoside hydrolase family 16 protein [Anaeromyxobacter oryzae]|uniref:Beta-glucanase n=1 Tax=Anaeromyxobacter oryzae TaxID=2918170 RepID=A0ABM7WV95_9BACT|nr:glycoside hydrolase family 16 protein [Anaeromyxobacter oryzae]BDG03424.1 beta-glucanase [Anaeromyxobacter oryzae]